MAILLMVCPLASLLTHSRSYEFAVSAVGLVICTGLFVINYSLHAETNAGTPWRGPLCAMFVIVAASMNNR